jgi:multisubunit Na+/H+ antiporter MnhE subunit
MEWIRTISSEILGLFVDDAGFAVAIIAWLGVVRFISRHVGPRNVWSAVTLAAGLVLILIESAVRFAKRTVRSRQEQSNW